MCHIVAKKPFSAVLAAGLLMLVSESQTFLIFAYLRARERAVENNRFSMLKNSGFRRGGIPVAHTAARPTAGKRMPRRGCAPSVFGRQERRPSYGNRRLAASFSPAGRWGPHLIICTRARNGAPPPPRLQIALTARTAPRTLHPTPRTVLPRGASRFDGAAAEAAARPAAATSRGRGAAGAIRTAGTKHPAGKRRNFAPGKND